MNLYFLSAQVPPLRMIIMCNLKGKLLLTAIIVVSCILHLMSYLLLKTLGNERQLSANILTLPSSRVAIATNTVTLKRTFKSISISRKTQYYRQLADDGRTKFQKDLCAISSCSLTTNTDNATSRVFVTEFPPEHSVKPAGQIWIFYSWESPYYSMPYQIINSINWTVTYRSDSTIYRPFDIMLPKNTSSGPEQPINLKSKRKLVAWFVSNCRSRSRRGRYAKDLAKYIAVDIYGKCGYLSCSRTKSDLCLNMLREDYKFYLAFENSRCQEYITEKFFNALR